MHLKVALSITLIVFMELFLNRSVKNLHLAASKSDKISVPQRLRDEGFYRIKFFTFLKLKIRVYGCAIVYLYGSAQMQNPG
jgi:hypothetical protein